MLRTLSVCVICDQMPAEDTEMETIKPHKIIYRIIALLRAFGVWETDSQSNFRKLLKKFTLLIFTVTFCTSLALGAIDSVDRNEAIFLVASSIAFGLVNVKLSYILWKKKDLDKFLNRICVHTVEREEEFIKINKKLNNFANVAYTAMAAMSSSITVLIVSSMPFFSAERRLAVNIKFPFDWKTNALFHWCGWFFIAVALMYASLVTYFTIVYLYIMLNCSVKYQVLGDEIRNVNRAKDLAIQNKVYSSYSSMKELDKLRFRDLKKIIAKHQKLIE